MMRLPRARWFRLLGSVAVASFVVACGRVGFESEGTDASDAGTVAMRDATMDSSGGTTNDAGMGGRGDAGPVVVLTDLWQMGLSHALPAGSDRMLLVLFLAEDDDLGGPGVEVLSMTYGGQPMTRVPTFGRVVADSDAESVVEAWFLTETGLSAAAGATIAPTLSRMPSEEPHWASMSFDNVDQADSFGDGDTDSCLMCDSVSAMSVANRAGDVIVVGAEHGISGVMGYRLGSDWRNLIQSLSSHTSLATYRIAPGGEESVTVRGTIQRHALLAFVVRAR